MPTTERQQAFLDLLEPVYPRLSRYALAITRNVEEAEDLTSDTVLWALMEFDSVRDKARFTGFLFKLASRLHKRKRYRERFRMPFDERHAEARENEEPLPDQAAEIRLVMEALERLPARIRETVVLFEVADLKLAEIRNIQGGSLSGVKSRLVRGRAMLQKELGVSRTIGGVRTEEKNSLGRILITKTKDYAL